MPLFKKNKRGDNFVVEMGKLKHAEKKSAKRVAKLKPKNADKEDKHK